jgi:hypothetical protein
MKNGARLGATSHPDPTDATHGRLEGSDQARCLKLREMALSALEKKRQFSPFLGDGTSRDLGTAKEFIDQFSGRLNLECGTAEGAFPQKEKLINVFLRGSLRPGATALSETETIRRQVMEGGNATPEKVPFIPIFSHDLAALFPYDEDTPVSRLHGNKTENKVVPGRSVAARGDPPSSASVRPQSIIPVQLQT